jgi:hypothetical protein
MRKYANADNGHTGRERLAYFMCGDIDIPEENATARRVAVWENAVASKKLPSDLFRSGMDAWRETDGIDTRV